MIGRSLEGDEPIGIVFRDESGGARNVGCTARVADVLERFDDGRMNLVVSGEAPFRVLDRADAPEYPVGDVELVDLTEEPDPDDEGAARGARAAFAELLEQVSDERDTGEGLGEASAYGIASRIELP